MALGLTEVIHKSGSDSTLGLTIQNAAAEPGSLKIMRAVLCVFISLVLMYQRFACPLFSKPVTESDIASDEAC